MKMWFQYPGVAERFDRKAARQGECLVWTGGRMGGKKVRYGAFRLSQPVRVQAYAHRLALERKIGRALSSDEHVMHSCDNPPCVNPTHLRVGSRQENMSDCAAKGRTRRGEQATGARLTVRDVQEIRALLTVRGLTHKEIGARYGVSGPAISSISSGRTWRHVPAPTA